MHFHIQMVYHVNCTPCTFCLNLVLISLFAHDSSLHCYVQLGSQEKGERTAGHGGWAKQKRKGMCPYGCMIFSLFVFLLLFEHCVNTIQVVSHIGKAIYFIHWNVQLTPATRTFALLSIISNQTINYIDMYSQNVPTWGGTLTFHLREPCCFIHD